MKQVTSGWAVIASSTLCLARAWSTSSARTSTSSTFEPLIVARTPSIRSRALSAGRQTDEAHALAAVRQRLEGELTRLLARQPCCSSRCRRCAWFSARRCRW